MRLRLRILFFLRLLSGGKIESSISSAKVFTCNFGDSFPYCAHFMIYILLCIFLSNLASEGRLHIHTQECIQCTYSLCPWLLPSWGRSSELHCWYCPLWGRKRRKFSKSPWFLHHWHAQRSLSKCDLLQRMTMAAYNSSIVNCYLLKTQAITAPPFITGNHLCFRPTFLPKLWFAIFFLPSVIFLPRAKCMNPYVLFFFISLSTVCNFALVYPNWILSHATIKT